ncbi:MAG: hypothetical protein ABFS56_00805 [Pseudomonadota bacterium]
MNDEQEKQLFLERVNQLFSEIKTWFRDDFKIEQQIIDVTESLGTYRARALSINSLQGEKLADIRPIGARVIAADGRIDIKGWLDTENLYFFISAPTTTLRVSIGSLPAGTIVPRTQIYKGVEVNGWYWIDNQRAHLLNKELLFDLISHVSDYDF